MTLEEIHNMDPAPGDANPKGIALIEREFRNMRVAEIRSLIGLLPVASRRQLLILLRNLVRDPEFCRDQSVRVCTVMALVASLPDSLGQIKTLLKDFSTPLSYELHFSLFCNLDLVELPRNEELRKKVLAMVGRYLRNARVEKGYAAWMAGDLLGDHWSTEEAFSLLCDIAVKAKYPVARESAIHGLAHALGRANAKQRSRIQDTLRKVLQTDKNQGVRLSSRMALEGHGK